MSIERPVNGPCRSASTNFGADRPLHQFLERRVEPLDVPDLERHARAFGQRDQVVGLGDRAADGFSTSTGMPALRNAAATAWWWIVGVTTLTASTRPRSGSK